MDLNNTKNTLRTNTTMLYGTHFALIPSSLNSYFTNVYRNPLEKNEPLIRTIPTYKLIYFC